jgi:ribosomal protein S24E
MLKITQQKRNELLKRDEIYALKEDLKTPKIEETKAEIAGILKKDSGAIAVKRIKGRFGSRQFVVEAYAYDNQDIMNRTEPKAKAKKADAGVPAEEAKK